VTGRIPPDGLDPMESASTDGLYLVQKSGNRFREWYRLLVSGGVSLTLDDIAHTASLSVTIAASGGGAGELLMQDGVTGPPAPIETEAGDDWLYEG
jgi:hypothetical protein